MTPARTTHAVQVDSVPTLTLELLAPYGPVEVGAEAIYEMRVVNAGIVPADGVTLAVSVPEGLRPLSGEGPAAARVEGQQVLFAPVAQLGSRVDAVYRVKVAGLRAGQGQLRAVLQAASLPRPLAQEVTASVRGPASAGR
jgi:hypothetical protein